MFAQFHVAVGGHTPVRDRRFSKCRPRAQPQPEGSLSANEKGRLSRAAG